MMTCNRLGHALVYRDGRGTFDVHLRQTWWRMPEPVQGHHRRPLLPGQGGVLREAARPFRAGWQSARLLAACASGRWRYAAAEQWDLHRCSGEAGDPDAGPAQQSIERRKMSPGAQKASTLKDCSGPASCTGRNNYTIDPERRVYKCPRGAGPPGLEVGAGRLAKPRRRSRPARAPAWEKCGELPVPAGLRRRLPGRQVPQDRAATKWPARRTCSSPVRESVVQRYLAEFPQ